MSDVPVHPPKFPAHPGTRYGSWTILSFSHRDRHKRVFYLCRCDCGTEKPVAIPTLRDGGSQGCKTCANKDRTRSWLASDRSPKPGQRYGEWTVLAYSHSDYGARDKRHFFLCRCSCGYERAVSAPVLRAGTSTRCLDCKNRDSRLAPLKAGERYGSWTVLSFAFHKEKHNQSYYLCRCDCGYESTVLANRLRYGLSTRCRCCAPKTHGCSKGGPHLAEFRIWNSMRARCGNPNHTSWKRYGGRGIRVCERWLDFPNFLADMGPRPGPAYSLDRVDNDGNYEKSNVVWATKRQQGNNRGDCHFLEFEGESLTIAEWARRKGINPITLAARIYAGWSVERAIMTPVTATKNASTTPQKDPRSNAHSQGSLPL